MRVGTASVAVGDDQAEGIKTAWAYKQVEKIPCLSFFMTEAFSDYAGLISNNPRYADVLQQGSNVAGMAQASKRQGMRQTRNTPTNW